MALEIHLELHTVRVNTDVLYCFTDANLIEEYDSQLYNATHGYLQRNSRNNNVLLHLKATKVNLSQILSVIPSIEESLPVNSSNPLCAKHSRFVLHSANQLELWALKSKYRNVSTLLITDIGLIVIQVLTFILQTIARYVVRSNR